MSSLIAAGVSAADAARQVLAGSPIVAPDAETPLADVRGQLHAALRRMDEAMLEASIDRVLASFGLDTAISDVFLPALRDLGEDWATGAVTVAQEHFAVTVLRGRLLALARGWDAGLGPRAVLACPPGELHDVSLITFGLALRRRGWRITFLGANTPLEDVFATQDRIGARLTVLFASDWEVHRALIPVLKSSPSRRIALGGATAAPIAEAAGCRWLQGDPVTAAEAVTRADAAATGSPLPGGRAAKRKAVRPITGERSRGPE
jgi:methanogenic corrinoid protein MtbC1